MVIVAGVEYAKDDLQFLQSRNELAAHRGHDAELALCVAGVCDEMLKKGSDLLVLGNQQTSDRSFRHCPIFGE